MSLDRAAVLASARDWVWVPPEAREVRTDDYHLIAYSPTFAEPTVVHRIDSAREPAELVDEVLARVAELGRDRVVLWPGARPAGLPEHLLARGAVVHEELAVLARRLGPDADLDGLHGLLAVPDDLEVRPVGDLATMRDHERVGVAAFGGEVRPDDELAVDVERQDPETGVSVVCYRDGTAISTGGLTVAGETARLWGGATLPDARHRGGYRAVLAWRLALGRELGCTSALVTGRLTTSAPTLRRAGFEQHGEMRGYLLRLV